MFSTRECPHTGIVNYFADTEPHFSIGSVVKSGVPARYKWRCYLGERPGSGVAPDLQTAECRLMWYYREFAAMQEETVQAYRYRTRSADRPGRLL